jgi:hypothetical protein
MTSQIAAAAARYGVPAEAIAGALVQERFDQTDSLTNYARMVGSSLVAREFLDRRFIDGRERNRLHPTQGASDIILDKYNADPNAMTVGRDIKEENQKSSARRLWPCWNEVPERHSGNSQ